eukprot:CAMPEP_0119345186 /NCGR_PEP_ID=MMETSP1333-20130426/107356_1 /TAXON_ID=418940 /ORGANISM="Scyphosphaera apsteinii, Strain RCC1455" /LENGTH=99 /DNA_ID=CAMNT_0007357645 /DNA_START=355 /DNA_END=653 /DNA_ORIENTATION=+
MESADLTPVVPETGETAPTQYVPATGEVARNQRLLETGGDGADLVCARNGRGGSAGSSAGRVPETGEMAPTQYVPAMGEVAQRAARRVALLGLSWQVGW